ncbi:MAG: hypothetical protein IPK15_27310 [Verrucomicrobia bacterium]|nr:hypothetical protein [Verrucomicrobiota bacterium]
MMRDRVLPDEIHNYAHNNEWLIPESGLPRSRAGRHDLAKNMVELPRHPAAVQHALTAYLSPTNEISSHQRSSVSTSHQQRGMVARAS